MLSVQRLKKELLMNMELNELLESLKWIASSQFHALEKRKERFLKFLDAFEGFFQMLDFSSIDHPFAHSAGALAIIMITSDEGFMGGLNTRVINTALNYEGATNAKYIIIGERGAGYLRDMGLEYKGFPGVSSEDRYEAALRLKDYVIKEGLAGNFARLIIVYPRPVSFTVQKVEIIKILPCSEMFEKRTDVIENKEHIIRESSLSALIEYLLEAWITQILFQVLEDSKLAEFSARTVHLEECNQVLMQRSKILRFQYFRSRHEFVDRGMRETFAGKVIRDRKK